MYTYVIEASHKLSVIVDRIHLNTFIVASPRE